MPGQAILGWAGSLAPVLCSSWERQEELAAHPSALCSLLWAPALAMCPTMVLEAFPSLSDPVGLMKPGLPLRFVVPML